MSWRHETRWTVQKIAQRLELIEPLVYRRRVPLNPFRAKLLDGPDVDPPVGPQVDDTDWELIQPKQYWGEWKRDFVLRTDFHVPAGWDSHNPVALYLPLGVAGDFSHPEALAYIDGHPLAACDRHHQEIRLPEGLQRDETHLLALHGWTGRGGRTKGEPNTRLFLHTSYVVQIDQATRDFIATARVALQTAAALPEEAPAWSRLLDALDEAFKILDTREPFGEAFYNTVPAAHERLREELSNAGPPMDVPVTAVGHAHIDVAWLWTLAQTRRKAGRTFHTALHLMDQFPGYHFSQSQAQLYDYVRQDYPGLFERIKERVKEGRWEVIGGMWVEADCNLSGGESLARQFVLGRRFFREHFGSEAESPVLWLPDVFGYAWNLPQLIKQAGLDYFFTIKISWSQYNRLPYDTFWWQGLDGTRVLTHFSTVPEDAHSGSSTYNAKATPVQALAGWRRHQQKGAHRNLLMVYGHGDGGGGPTRQMLENIEEMGEFPALPQVSPGKAASFFRQIEASAGARLPTWNGELYLELHRGTYTTQGRTKRGNRKSEFLLHDAEYLATLASLLDPAYTYPQGELRRGWELLCLNQFHDILPGSSIAEVYVDALQQFEEIREIAERVSADASREIANRCGGDLVLINPSSFTRHDLAFWPGQLGPGQALYDSDGTPLAVQRTDNGSWIAFGEVAPFGTRALHIADGQPAATRTDLVATPNLLENDFLRVELDDAGDITRIYDKHSEREVLPPGAVANQFQAFEDRPLDWDAWDVDIYYEDKMWLAEPASSVQLVEQGPLRATLELHRQILGSHYVQRISLTRNSPQLDVETVIEWQERHILLKVAFPVEVLSPTATYEIQWGNVERPTHRNTSWDWARFETCAQKWVDLSEGQYGVSLLNDCKYGHDIRDNVIRLSLLRSPTSPDPEADQGEHRFVYSLRPHEGRWDETTIAAAYALNDPLRVVAGEGQSRTSDEPLLASLFAVDAPNVVIETVKRAEDGNGVIVRLYESQRGRGRVTLRSGFPLSAAWRTNLLEENEEALQTEENAVGFDINPYQIVTLRLVPHGGR